MSSGVEKGPSRLRDLWLAAALVVATLAAWPLLATPGLVNTRAGGDSPFLLLRTYELQANLRAGTLPARWMPDAAYGLGYPFFNYYASLPYYLGAALSLAGAGVLWGLKLAQLIGFLGAAVAMYALAGELFDDHAAGFLAAAAYTLAPFHMVNVYVRGDSLSEFYAFVFYPLILWSILRLRRRPTAGHIAILACAYAGLMLSHNISALIFSPLAGLVLLVAAATAPRARLRVFLLGAAGLLLGAALSAWFWVPALLERGAVSLNDMTTGYFNYAGHFRWAELVQRSLRFDYAIDAARTPFAMGGLQAGLAAMGLAALLVAGLRQRRRLALALGLALLAGYAIWPITPSSSALWAHVPLLPMVQFPWRFLSIASLATALLTGAGLAALRSPRIGKGALTPAGRALGAQAPGSPATCAGRGEALVTSVGANGRDFPEPGCGHTSPLPAHVAGEPTAPAQTTHESGSTSPLPAHVGEGPGVREPIPTILRSLLAVALGALLAYSALALLRPEPLPVTEADITPERLQLYEHLTGNVGSTVRAEYLPGQAVPRPFTGAALLAGDPHPAPVAVAGTLAGAHLLAAAPTSQTWTLEVTAPEATVAFRTYAFPGWQATVDGLPAAIDARIANGRIALTLAAGRHEVALRLTPTPLRRAAEALSLAAALAALALAVIALIRARAWRGAAFAAGLVALTLGAGLLLGVLSAHAAPSHGALATETMDFIRLPYLHRNPSGVAFGDTLRLAGYELSTQEAAEGDVVQVRLHWQATSDAPLRVAVRLTTAAEPLLQAPSLAQSEAPLAAVTEHALTIPPEAAPGLALLAVEVRGPDGPLSPHTGQGAGLGTIYLAPVRVRPPAPSSQPAVGRLGQSTVDLLQAAVTEPSPGALDVRLTWRPNAPLGEDYVTTVRLLDAEGHAVPGAGLDVQPRYGMYPTSLWPAGVPVADLYRLTVPRGTPPGSSYQVEVGFYQARTLRGLGSLRIADVTLAQPTIDAGAPLLHEFGGLALSSWQLEREEISDGEELAAQVQWAATAAPLLDAAWRLVLIDEQGREVAARQAAITPGFPPSRWPEHALVNGRVSGHVAPGTPEGRYDLTLEVLAPDGRALGRWQAPNEIRVKAAQRQTTLPAFAHPVGVVFGGQIRLPGYDLETSDRELAVTLHWQALEAPQASYKVFLHLYDPTTNENVAQRDAFPLGDTYFTIQWAPGEVVSDRLVLDMAQVPHGRYLLAAGWYDPVSGERLEPAGDPARISDRRVVLQEVAW
ncbi:MAG TPA: 6-pyruvoyl-tetrahydropterin synthase-related protein [Anaerolineae bacterium]|nr:6-pyruvoyl-tetrahydropterin synthase-related protein [Anaerolineae bacterium]